MKSSIAVKTIKTSPHQGLNKKIKGTIHRNVYQWHRIIGIITIIPVIFWTVSGLMHPLMANFFSPVIPKTFKVPLPITPVQVSLEPKEVLEMNGIETFKKMRLAKMENETFYQVQLTDDKIEYFNASSGETLQNGDIKYAEYLARYFLGDTESQLEKVAFQKEFDEAYKYVNRLLPVWRLDFDRPDNMTIYVETTSDRLGTFNPTSRKIFIRLFSTFHNWSWLEGITGIWWRTTIMMVFLGIIIGSALSGLLIYGLMWRRFQKPYSGNQKSVLRKFHRQIGLATALVTLTFAFSGGYQATAKYKTNILPEMVYEPEIRTSDLIWPMFDIRQIKAGLINFGIVQKEDGVYYQLQVAKDKGSNFEYYSAKDGGILSEGDAVYASFLAQVFAKRTNLSLENAKVVLTEKQTGFSHDYGFVFKRLPVQHVRFNTEKKHSLYIETQTSRLAASIADPDRTRGFTFAVLHKYFLMDWAGKTIRDGMMMFSALGVLVVGIFGLVVFIRK